MILRAEGLLLNMCCKDQTVDDEHVLKGLNSVCNTESTRLDDGYMLKGPNRFLNTKSRGLDGEHVLKETNRFYCTESKVGRCEVADIHLGEGVGGNQLLSCSEQKQVLRSSKHVPCAEGMAGG